MDLFSSILDNLSHFQYPDYSSVLENIISTPDFQSNLLKNLADDFPGGTIIGNTLNLIYISRYTSKTYIEWITALTSTMRSFIQDYTSFDLEPNIQLNTTDILLITYDQEFKSYNQQKIRSLARELTYFLV